MVALATAAIRTVIQEKIRQRMREDGEHRSAEKRRAERSLDETTELLIEIEEIRNSLTQEKKNRAERLADRAEPLPEALEESRKRIDFQLARITENYAKLVEAGNVRSRSDGTFEIVDLSGLTESQERMARLAIEQDNAYIAKSHNVRSAIERMTTVVNERRSELEDITTSTPQELLQKSRSPEELYQEALAEIIEAYRPERAGKEPQGSAQDDPAPRRQGTPTHPVSPQETAPREGTVPPKHTDEGARGSVVTSPGERLVELASRAQTSVPRQRSQEMGMGY